jgi:hypothetical protein
MRADEMGPEKMGWGRKEERGGAVVQEYKETD